MEPNKSPLMLALRTPLRLTAALFALLVVAGSASAQLPALPSTDDLPIDSDLDTGIATPIGGIEAGAQDDTVQACADAHASGYTVTGLVPVPVPAYAPVSADLSQCAEVDAGQTLDDAAQQAEDAQYQAHSFLDQVKSFFDDVWDGLMGAF